MDTQGKEEGKGKRGWSLSCACGHSRNFETLDAAAHHRYQHERKTAHRLTDIDPIYSVEDL